MEKRTYNIFFHLHTISGIVISVGLFIIFFAGAFTLFEHAIHHWEEEKHHETKVSTESSKPIDLDRLVATLKTKGYDLYGRDISLTLEGEEEQPIYLSGSKDSLASAVAKKNHRLSVNTKTYNVSKQEEHFSLGSLLYDLHFYYQLGRPGYYLSGIVALFFLFALVTGVVIHWDKLVSNFFVFRPWEKLKTVWTDAHTALGTIGLPFQFMYALTGAMFGLGILVALSASVLYGGDKEKFYDELYGNHSDNLGKRANVSAYSLNSYLDSAKTRWKGFKPKYITIVHAESSTLQFRAYGYLSTKIKFLNGGEVVYDVMTGKVNHEHNPYEIPYSEGVWPTVYRLHFADYGELGVLGNNLLKLIYFIMAMITCFVIITGVLIWLEARNKKHVPENEKRYNKRVGYIYLSICLSMLPITAFSFIVSKLVPEYLIQYREVIINSVFFGGWLLLSIYLFFRKNNYLINKITLLSGGLLGLCVPIVSGFTSGNWIWSTFVYKYYDIFIVDALWLMLSSISFYTLYKMKNLNRTQKAEKEKIEVLLTV